MLREIAIESIEENPFNLFGSWALACAGDEQGHNAMAIGWGTLGVLWNKNVATVYIRPQRYTREFMDRCQSFSICFFSGEDRKAILSYGRISGRDADKDAIGGFTHENDGFCSRYKEARLVIECRKIYRDCLREECFVDTGILEQYPEKDYHYVYVGEIEKVLVQE